MIQLTDSLIGIDVPLDAYNITIFSDHVNGEIKRELFYFYGDKGNSKDEFIPLLQGEYEIIGTVTKDEVTFDCEEYVEYKLWDGVFNSVLYRDYRYPLIKMCVLNGEYSQTFLNGFQNKEDSFRSLIESKSRRTFINPLGERPTLDGSIIGDSCEFNLQAWQTAENILLHKVVVLELKNK